MYNEFARYEEAFKAWCQDGYPTNFPSTYRYIDFLSDASNDQAPREGTLWPHQWESFLRVIYSYEVLGQNTIGKHGLLLNIVDAPVFNREIWHRKGLSARIERQLLS